MRVSALTSKDLTKEGISEVNKLWTKLTDTLKPSNIIKKTNTRPKSKKKLKDVKNVNEAIIKEDNPVLKAFAGNMGMNIQTPLKVTKKKLR